MVDGRNSEDPREPTDLSPYLGPEAQKSAQALYENVLAAKMSHYDWAVTSDTAIRVAIRREDFVDLGRLILHRAEISRLPDKHLDEIPPILRRLLPGVRGRIRTAAAASVAINLASAQKFDDALRLARVLSHPSAKGQALVSVAKHQALVNDIASATNTIETELEVERRSSHLGHVAQSLASEGRYEFADAVVAKVADPFAKASTLIMIAETQLARDDRTVARSSFVRALHLVEEIVEVDDRLDILALAAGSNVRIGNPTISDQIHGLIAKQISPVLPSHLDASTRLVVVQLLASIGDFDTAFEIVEAAVTRYPADAEDQVISIAAIARFQCAAADIASGIETFGAARRTAFAMRDKLHKAFALAEVAEQEALLGNVKDARETADLALATANSIMDDAAKYPDDGSIQGLEADRNHAVDRIITCQIVGGDFEGALQTARATGEEYWTSLAYYLQACAAAAERDTGGATILAQQVVDSTLKAAALMVAAGSQCRAGNTALAIANYEQALNSAKSIEDRFTREVAIANLIDRQIGGAGTQGDVGIHNWVDHPVGSGGTQDELWLYSSVPALLTAKEHVREGHGGPLSTNEALNVLLESSRDGHSALRACAALARHYPEHGLAIATAILESDLP